MERILRESMARIDLTGAKTITKEELDRCGIDGVGIGEADTKRISAVCSSTCVNLGTIDFSAATETGFTKKNIVPSHVIDVPVFILKDAPKCGSAVTAAINAFATIREEVKAEFGPNAEFVMRVAVQNHANEAYHGYVDILAVHNNVEKVSVPRVEAIKHWVHTLRIEVEKASVIVDILKQLRREKFLLTVKCTKIGSKKNAAAAQEEDVVEVDY
jgi:hypothetical protein